LKAGERVFDVAIQGRTVLKSFDIVQEAGGADRAMTREFKGVKVKDLLTIELVPSAGAKEKAAVLCGVEMRSE